MINNDTKEKLRVGIYLRLSNEDRDKSNIYDPSESIKNQRNMLLDYINSNSCYVLYDEYCDSDLSGAGTYRPEFERLIRDCEKGNIDIVLCKSQSRFSRDMEIVEKYINNKFIEWNVRFIGLSDNADTDNNGNKKSRQINGLVNEWFLEDVSNNIRSAFKSKMKNGEFISPFAPYGYNISLTDNNKLVVDPVASCVVKDIYNLYLNGFGFTSIAKYLNDRNVPCPSLYKYYKGIKLNIISNKLREEIVWSASAIKKILTNEIYLGNLIQGKRTTISYKNHKIVNKNKNEWVRVNGTHDAIIDDDTFYKVNKIISSKKRRISKKGIVHVFSGKVFCLECGFCMRKKCSSLHEYLVCSNSLCCNKTSIRYDEFEKIILVFINDNINKYFDISMFNRNGEKLLNDKIGDNIKIINNKYNDIINKRHEKENYLKCLYDDRVNGVINFDQFNVLIKKYNDEIEYYDKELNDINNKLNYYKNREKELLNNNIYNKYKKINKLSSIVVDEFIDKIYIGRVDCFNKYRNIKVKWNFK